MAAAGAGSMWGSSLFAADPSPNLGHMAYQLGWIKNFQFAGDYVADSKGYYQKFGLSGVDLLVGGPGVVVDPVVASGKALVGQSSPDFMANAINHGAPLVCIGTSYQRNADCVVSLARNPLRTPHDMIGKKIGLQTMNLVIWYAFLKLNKIDPRSIHTVPVQFDFTPLISGEVDGFFGQETDDVVHLRAKGYDLQVLAFNDFGYKMFIGTYSVRTDSLTDPFKRAQLVAFMKASALGWNEVIKDPDEGARLTVDVYGKGNGLNPSAEQMSCRVANQFYVSPDTQAHGLFWMSAASVQETIETLAASGVKATPAMFTNEILQEAYGS